MHVSQFENLLYIAPVESLHHGLTLPLLALTTYRWPVMETTRFVKLCLIGVRYLSICLIF